MSLLDLVLPASCGGCGRSGDVWCRVCSRSVRPASRADERFLRADPGIVVGDALEVAVAACAYEARLRTALARLKYGGVRRLAGPLAVCAEPGLRRTLALLPDATLVPVPVHADRLRDRGYNQAALLAAELGRRCGRPVADMLERRRPTEKQHRLDRAARLRNLVGAFAVRARPPPAAIVLVDDILTTSATLEACAAVLLAAGTERVVGCAVAREL